MNFFWEIPVIDLYFNKKINTEKCVDGSSRSTLFFNFHLQQHKKLLLSQYDL